MLHSKNKTIKPVHLARPVDELNDWCKARAAQLKEATGQDMRWRILEVPAQPMLPDDLAWLDISVYTKNREYDPKNQFASDIMAEAMQSFIKREGKAYFHETSPFHDEDNFVVLEAQGMFWTYLHIMDVMYFIGDAIKDGQIECKNHRLAKKEGSDWKTGPSRWAS